MNTQLQTFSFQSHQLTALTDEYGEPWFIAMEVAEILEYSDAHKMTSKLDEDEVQNRQIRGSGFNNKGTIIINESGLWSSVLRSTKPEAKAVKKWLTSEVLPAIRKTGSYHTDSNLAYQTLQTKYIGLLEEKLTRLAAEEPVKRRPFSKAEKAAALRSRAEGYSLRDIANLLHRDKGSMAGLFARLAKGGVSHD